uniref:Uncharacterized protein n=1 Tax=Spongospora subterranea TaxID=70186 RepID=A0A0H5QTI3_9EUKA|eukprot:CRZ05235.1 hypothetical protein [Spongospora subterranea]
MLEWPGSWNMRWDNLVNVEVIGCLIIIAIADAPEQDDDRIMTSQTAISIQGHVRKCLRSRGVGAPTPLHIDRFYVVKALGLQERIYTVNVQTSHWQAKASNLVFHDVEGNRHCPVRRQGGCAKP